MAVGTRNNTTWRDSLKAGASRRWATERQRDIDRIKTGDINAGDRSRLMRYHRRSVDLGEFTGSLHSWLKLNGVDLPPITPRGNKATDLDRVVDMDNMTACASIAGPEVLWCLMMASGELPQVPSSRRRVELFF